MSQINYSHSHGGLTCSFNDYQLAEYTQNRRRAAGRLPVKHSVERVGPQSDGSWVLGPSLFFNREGELLQPEESMYAWLGNIYDGPGIAHHSTACKIQMPLSIDPLRSLYMWARENMCHNFMPCMLLAGTCCMALHYKKILSKFLFCPVPIAYGKTPKQQHSVSDLVRWEYTHPASYPRQRTRSTQIYVAQAIFRWALTTQNRNPLLVISSYHFLMEQKGPQ